MRPLNRHNTLALSLAIVLAGPLAGCGGGGGSNTKPSTPATTTVTPTQTSIPLPSSYNPLVNQLFPENVPEAWAIGGSATSNQGQGVKIGILDGGADPTNEALIDRITWFQDYVTPSNTTPQDPYGHGTVMAEIIGGTANLDGSGGNPFYGGVAPQSELYIARVGDSSGNVDINLLAQALPDLQAQGVKLFNNSYGSTQEITSVTASNSTVQFEAQTIGPVISAGGLMVWAAGNNATAQPTIESGLPYLVPSLQSGWLAVVNVTLNANGQVTGLDSTSNACGVAAAWCLAAPGTEYFTPVANTTFSTGGADGTSDSAAVVTGVAALVWQRFPYFSANNVQETLLGTATSLGSPSLYGYGMVNAQAAVNGPGALDWGLFDVSIPSGSSGTFANNMSGSGSLELDGAGTLTLSGTDTYTGGTSITGGTLLVNGSVASAVAVGAGATLGGSGTINANVANSGTVTTLDGALAINGNYTPASSANTSILISAPLKVSGTATLNGSTVTTTVPSGYTPQAEEPLVEAGVLSGTFGTLDLTGSVYLSGTLSYTATEAEVALSRESVSSVAIASLPNVATTQQTAQHIEGALEQADQWAASDPAAHAGFLDAAGDFLHAASDAVAAASINSLSGQVLASSQGLTLEQAGIVNRTVADHLDDLGHGAAQGGVWFQGTGADGDIARSGYATGSYSGGGAVAGYDAVLSDNWTLGGALDWNHLSSSYDLSAGTSTSRSTGGMLYGKFSAGQAYVAGRVGEDWISAATSRWAMLGATPAPISSTRNDHLTSAYLEAGYDVASAAWTTTPFVAVGDERLARGTIDENGAGGFGIAADSHDFNQSTGQLGARLAYAWSWSGGQTWLKGYALYQRVFAGSDLGFSAAYAGAPAATFQLEGVNTPRNSGWVGLGIDTALGDRWSWFANLDGQVAGGGTKATVLSAGAQYRF